MFEERTRRGRDGKRAALSTIPVDRASSAKLLKLQSPRDNTTADKTRQRSRDADGDDEEAVSKRQLNGFEKTPRGRMKMSEWPRQRKATGRWLQRRAEGGGNMRGGSTGQPTTLERGSSDRADNPSIPPGSKTTLAGLRLLGKHTSTQASVDTSPPTPSKHHVKRLSFFHHMKLKCDTSTTHIKAISITIFPGHWKKSMCGGL